MIKLFHDTTLSLTHNNSHKLLKVGRINYRKASQDLYPIYKSQKLDDNGCFTTFITTIV